MKKIHILPVLFVTMFSGFGQAAETGCGYSLGRDYPVNLQECSDSQALTQERDQDELTGISEINYVPMQADVQSVLCSQCHQGAVKMGQQSASVSPHGMQDNQTAYPSVE